jgi:hypothetical protein
MLTLEQTGPFLSMIIGAGGVSGMTAAVFGYLKAVREGRPPAEMPNITIGAPDSPAIEAASLALGSIAGHLVRLIAVIEIDAEQRFEGRDFRSQVDGREMLILKASLKGHDED